LELLAQLLKKPYFPVIENADPISVGLYYTFGTTHPLYNINPGDRLIDDHWQVGLHYEISGAEYSFSMSENQSADIIQEYERSEYHDIELIKDYGDIRVYSQTPRNDDWINKDWLLDGGNPELLKLFGLDVRGLWVSVTVYGFADVQSAVDGIMAFEFSGLIR